MAVTKDFLQYVLEQLREVGLVASRRMFGGVGLYHDGLFFALIDDDTLYFKVDEQSRADYEARGRGPFRPFADKPDYTMAYYEVPADVLESPEDLAQWAQKAITIAAKAPKKKSATSPKTKRAKRKT